MLVGQGAKSNMIKGLFWLCSNVKQSGFYWHSNDAITLGGWKVSCKGPLHGRTDAWSIPTLQAFLDPMFP